MQAPTWDQIKDASIPGMCTHPPTTLVDGKDVTLGEYDGYLELLQTLPSGSAGMVTVPSNDAGPLTAIVVSCSAGGVGWPDSIAFFKPSGDFYGYHDLFTDVDWESEGMSGPGRDGVGSLMVEGGTLSVSTSATYPTDPECCPSTGAWVELVPRDGTVAPQGVYEDLGDEAIRSSASQESNPRNLAPVSLVRVLVRRHLLATLSYEDLVGTYGQDAPLTAGLISPDRPFGGFGASGCRGTAHGDGEPSATEIKRTSTAPYDDSVAGNGRSAEVSRHVSYRPRPRSSAG